MITQSAVAGASPSRARYLAPTTPSTRATSTPPAIGFFGVLRAIRAAARLTSTERLVLLVIASHLDNATGEACPGIPKLAAECSLTTRTIERTIAALVAAGWLARDSAASRWGTNVYRVTPRPDDVRPPRRYGRPFDRATPDRASGDPPSPVRVTPDTRSADLLLWNLHEGSAVNAPPPPRGPHTHPDFMVYQGEPEHLVADGDPEALVAGLDVAGEELVADGGPEGDLELGEHPEAALDAAPERDAIRTTKAPPVVAAPSAPPVVRAELGEHPEAALDVGILDALGEHPELRALARPPVAALVAREGRPLPVVRRALAELAEHARDAAAVGERWSVATLARKARAYVRRAYADPVTRATSTPAPEPPPPPRPRLASTVGHLRALRAALDTPSTATPRRLR